MMGIGFTAPCNLLLLYSSQSLVAEPCQFSHANISNRPLLANCDALCMRPGHQLTTQLHTGALRIGKFSQFTAPAAHLAKTCPCSCSPLQSRSRRALPTGQLCFCSPRLANRACSPLDPCHRTPFAPWLARDRRCSPPARRPSPAHGTQLHTGLQSELGAPPPPACLLLSA
jgi:hypothetical protein